MRSVRRTFKLLIELGFVERKRSQFRNGYRLSIDTENSRFVVSEPTRCLSRVIKLKDSVGSSQMNKMDIADGQIDYNRGARRPLHVSRHTASCSETTTKTTNSLSSYSSPSLKPVRGDESEERKEESKTIQKLISIWEAHIPVKGGRVQLKEARNKVLLLVFAKHFKIKHRCVARFCFTHHKEQVFDGQGEGFLYFF